MKKFLFLIFILTILFSLPCMGIRVSGKNIVNFEPYLEKTFELCISISKNNRVTNISVVEHPLSQYVTVEDNQLEFNRAGRQCTSYTVKFPEQVEVYGKQRVYIFVQEIDPNSKSMFEVIPSMKHPLEVIIPYPGKYLTGSLSIKDAEEGGQAEMKLSVTNKGKETVSEATSLITIYDVHNNSLAKLQPSSITEILPGETKSVDINWSVSGQKKGTYHAKADVNYAEIMFDVDSEFHIGGLNVEVMGHTVNITNGSITPIEVTVQSQWTDPIGEVFLEIELNGKKTKTPHQEVKPWAMTTFVGYVDATKFSLGEKDIKVTTHFSGKTSEYNGKIKVVPKPVEEKEFDFDIEISTTTILIFVIVILIGANVVWFILYKRKNNKNNDHAHQKTLSELGFELGKK